MEIFLQTTFIKIKKNYLILLIINNISFLLLNHKINLLNNIIKLIITINVFFLNFFIKKIKNLIKNLILFYL